MRRTKGRMLALRLIVGCVGVWAALASEARTAPAAASATASRPIADAPAVGLKMAGAAGASLPLEVRIPGDRVFPESITAAADGTLYIGSMAMGVIFRALPAADHAEFWIPAGTNGLKATFGVFADDKSQSLWVCSGAPPGAPPTGENSVLHQFDLKTGAPKAKYPVPGTKAVCNDIARGDDGSIYATDTSNMQVLRLAPKAQQLEVWAGNGAFGPPGGVLDGIAFTSKSGLYVSTLANGKVFHVAVERDGKAGKITEVTLSRPLNRPDGVRALGANSVLAAEVVGSLARVTFDGDSGRVETLKEGLEGPVSVAVVGETAYVLEGQLGVLFSKDPNAKTKPFHAVAVSLPEPGQ